MATAPKVTGFADLPVAAKALLLVLLLGVVTALYYFVFHMPLADDLSSADTNFTNLQSQEQEAQRRQQEFIRLSEDLAGRQALDRENRRVLPEDPEIPAFLQDLNRVGELSGLEFKLVEPRPEEQPTSVVAEETAQATPAVPATPGAPQTPPAAAPLYVRIPVSLQLKGRFHQVAKFFYNVSQLDRAISMENVRLENPTVEGEEVYLDVQVMATTFRRNASASTPPVAGGAAQ